MSEPYMLLYTAQLFVLHFFSQNYNWITSLCSRENKWIHQIASVKVNFLKKTKQKQLPWSLACSTYDGHEIYAVLPAEVSSKQPKPSHVRGQCDQFCDAVGRFCWRRQHLVAVWQHVVHFSHSLSLRGSQICVTMELLSKSALYTDPGGYEYLKFPSGPAFNTGPALVKSKRSWVASGLNMYT